jgi:hypothetical protein
MILGHEIHHDRASGRNPDMPRLCSSAIPARWPKPAARRARSPTRQRIPASLRARINCPARTPGNCATNEGASETITFARLQTALSRWADRRAPAWRCLGRQRCNCRKACTSQAPRVHSHPARGSPSPGTRGCTCGNPGIRGARCRWLRAVHGSCSQRTAEPLKISRSLPGSSVVQMSADAQSGWGRACTHPGKDIPLQANGILHPVIQQVFFHAARFCEFPRAKQELPRQTSTSSVAVIRHNSLLLQAAQAAKRAFGRTLADFARLFRRCPRPGKRLIERIWPRRH